MRGRSFSRLYLMGFRVFFRTTRRWDCDRLVL